MSSVRLQWHEYYYQSGTVHLPIMYSNKLYGVRHDGFNQFLEPCDIVDRYSWFYCIVANHNLNGSDVRDYACRVVFIPHPPTLPNWVKEKVYGNVNIPRHIDVVTLGTVETLDEARKCIEHHYTNAMNVLAEDGFGETKYSDYFTVKSVEDIRDAVKDRIKPSLTFQGNYWS